LSFVTIRVLSQFEFLGFFFTIWFFELSQFFYHLYTLTTDQLSGHFFCDSRDVFL
jgi:hypothetical protein